MSAARQTPRRAADRVEVARFVDALFRYADEGTFVSLRAFDQVDRNQVRAHSAATHFLRAGKLDPQSNLSASATASAHVFSQRGS